MNDIYSYDLEPRVLNGIDLAPIQPNYLVKYGNGAIEAQRAFLKKMGLGHLFERRVMIASEFGRNILAVYDLNYSGYHDENKSRCNGFDGVIVTQPDIPLLSGWGDCPWLLVGSDVLVGTVHAATKTLDHSILDAFFDLAAKHTSLASLKVGLSPYILPEQYSHPELRLQRKREWENAGAIKYRDGQFFLDLGAMIHADLSRIGIQDFNNAQLSSYMISERSHRQGGYAISHRHARQTPNAREGRGVFCVVLNQ